MSDLIDTRHAARILGVHISAIRRWLIEGKLAGKKIFGRWKASRKAVEDLARLPEPKPEPAPEPEPEPVQHRSPAWVDATLRRLKAR